MMDNGTLTIYSASAGSGKTFRLAGIYLLNLFRSRYNYRKILAVTFTNKATAEMKNRILDQLYKLSSGAKSEYLDDLVKETGKSEEKIRKEAQDLLLLILHDFSRFSISTIDAFFQRVIRSFARETGLQSGFNIELDHSLILSEAVDETLARTSSDPELAQWLNNYVLDNLGEEKTWNLKDAITDLSEELFREKFKILSGNNPAELGDKKFLEEYIKKVKSVRFAYESHLEGLAKKALSLYSEYDLDDEMFFYKDKGIPGYLRNLASGTMVMPNSYVRKVEEDPPKWSKGKIDGKLAAALDAGLETIVKEILAYSERNTVSYKSAEAILENIYAMGILSDVLRNVREAATSENSFLISDAGELLSLITKGDQAPFIYEKIGNRYENFMIDEFQDTSVLQWNNFQPLISNSMGEGNDNLVVGDIKQSIYRFRNSDWHILQDLLKRQVDNKRIFSVPLLKNWRSRSGIIRFNNSLFSAIPAIADEGNSEGQHSFSLEDIYSEAAQEDPGRKTGGYVRIEFVDDDKPGGSGTGDEDFEPVRKWKDKVLDSLPSVIERLQDKGYQASDIGILVRTSAEGAAVVAKMIDYGRTGKESYNFNIVSNDSLVLSNAHVITFIIAVLKVIDNQDDMISRAEMVRFFHLACGEAGHDPAALFREKLAENHDTGLPEGSEDFLIKAGQMPLFEAIENIISFYDVGKYFWNVSYLNTFQDHVLSFTASGRSDIRSFLEWWDSPGSSKSVVLPPDQDAMKVFTIHKSKGLEFPVVILPFISWSTDHDYKKKQILWAHPSASPFDDLSIVPLRYSARLGETIFAGDYYEEKWSACLDNINLLYVALTRAVDVIFGFAPHKTGSASGIARLMQEAIISKKKRKEEKGLDLSEFWNEQDGVFEFGEIPPGKNEKVAVSEIVADEYIVCRRPGSLKLKLHGENYFASGGEERRKRINYGKLMHEVFERISSIDDIEQGVMDLCREGKLNASEASRLTEEIRSHLLLSGAAGWFSPGTRVLKESEILLPTGSSRRPDRIILQDGKAIIIDFKFGDEKKQHLKQVGEYRDLISMMGYSETEAYLWYVEKNKIVKA